MHQASGFLARLKEAYSYHRRYFKKHGRRCDFKNPRLFSEKIYHRMRYPKPLFSVLADKITVRAHIAATIGEQYLVPAYQICDLVTPDIFNSLPAQFVMKANHSAGQVRVVRDKSKENIAELVSLANGWLKKDFSGRHKEKHYDAIKPGILFEQALLEDDKSPPDYKFNVFNPGNGQEPEVFIQYMSGRFEDIRQVILTADWELSPFQRRGYQTIPLQEIPRPQKLEEMIAVAKRLAAPFGYLRVDLYSFREKIYVGELTFTPGAGGYTFTPDGWDEKLGSLFKWPE